ncbi:DUF305 domain-containing protein [Micromonospora sp. WMMD1128]|uniref:DUF305 domain-containing protein n=1 Tax=Micromonospora sp. WMMD1128 TaxID=3015150 RepID=UPI00248C167D|nr:DUF305 domain-containing protein [Micromonospora sp. WMMD1128]WBB73651.1 DUF305 domain-containing protein [Micromonospora sp. WMMD1128]
MIGSALRTPAWRIAGVVVALAATTLAVALTRHADRVDQSGAPAAPVTLSGTDDAFIQLLLPMDDGVLALIDHLDTRRSTTDPALRTVLGDVRTAHRAEVVELRGLLAAGNVPERNIHEGHQMPGMVTDERLADLRAAPDAEVPSRAVGLLRAHLEQTVVLCQGERTAGGSPQVKELAGRIQVTRAAELSALAGRPGATGDAVN